LLVSIKHVHWNKLNLLSKAIHTSEQVCVRWSRTDAYYTAKLTFSHSSKCGVRIYTNVRIVFKIFLVDFSDKGILHQCISIPNFVQIG